MRVFTAGGARGSEAASTAYSIWRFPRERMPLTHGYHRPPLDMPQPGIDATTLRLRDLRLAWLSEPGILVCVGVHQFYRVSRLSLYGHTGVLGSGRSLSLRPTVKADMHF